MRSRQHDDEDHRLLLRGTNIAATERMLFSSTFETSR